MAKKKPNPSDDVNEAVERVFGDMICRQARDVPEIFCGDWQPYNVRPTHVGYYEVRNTKPNVDGRHSCYLTGGPFRYWDGTNWLPMKGDDRPSLFGQFTDHQWRGLKQRFNTPEELGLAVADYHNNLVWKGNRELADRQTEA